MQEAYCNTLKKLKEAMEEPQKESMEFVNYMHSQLKELTDHKSAGNNIHNFSNIYYYFDIIIYAIFK